VQSSGACNVILSTTAAGGINLGWSVNATDIGTLATSVGFFHNANSPVGAAQLEFPYAVSGGFTIAGSGPVTLFLNGINNGGNGGENCFGTNILMFATAQLQ
jgi:hypothetical protein